MNPADGRDAVLALYAKGPAMLERALADLQDADLDAPPSEGGWTVRQIVHHIADGDDLWQSCIKAALGNEQGEFTLEWYWALPQEVWTDRWAYAHRSLDVSVDLLKANRAHVLQLLDQVQDGWSRSIAIRKPDGQTERLQVSAVVEMQADHLVHHVNRILAIRRERGDA
jgi:uncharacterized damage-inducible protein DinB